MISFSLIKRSLPLSLNNHSIETHIVQKVQDCYHLATQYFGQDFLLPNIRFNQRGKMAGSARLLQNELRFNPVLLRDNLDEFVRHVVPHEVCHLLAFKLYGRVKPHGKEWQGLMNNLFNLPANTYHQMDVSKVAGQQFTYSCGCGSVMLGIRRHNKVIKGVQRYKCRSCHQELKLDQS